MSLIFGKPLKSKLWISLLAVLFLFAMIVVLLPVAIQVSAQSWLRDRGLDANIEFVGFNLNTGTFLVEDATGSNANSQGFHLDEALLEINWKSLFDKQLDIQRFKIEGLQLDVVSTDKGLNIAGIQMPANPQPQEKEPAPASDEPTSWSAQVQQIEFSNIKVCHNNPAVAISETLTIEQILKACATLNTMKWQGKIAWAAPKINQSVTAGVRVEGNLALDELLYASGDGKQRFFHLGNLVVENFETTGLEQFKTDLVKLANVDLLQHSKNQDAPYVASWKSLKVNRPVFDQQKQNAEIQSISLSGLKANVERTKTGITGLPVFPADKQPREKTGTVKADNPFTFAINKVTVNGTSQVSIVDKAVDPVFKESLSNINLSVADINSAKPGVKSPLSANLKVSEYGQINVEGTVQPFREKITIDLKLDKKHIDLANFSVYGKTFIGHKIHSGHLNLDSKVTINQGHLDTESTIILNKLKVESLEGKEAEKYKSDLGIPLSTALSLLRDSNDNIKLTIPVTGDMNSPDFSLNDVVSTVTSKVIKEAIINYYTPFGLVKLLGGVVDLATGLSFEPVVFGAGKSDLGQQGMDKLNSLSKLLSERPHVQLTFCGHPARSDILSRYKLEDVGLNSSDEKKPLKLTDKQTGELLALLRTRMDNMKKYMVKELKVNPGQVLLCSEPDNKQWVTGVDAQPEIAITI